MGSARLSSRPSRIAAKRALLEATARDFVDGKADEAELRVAARHFVAAEREGAPAAVDANGFPVRP